MSITDDFWRRSQAAQHSFLHLTSYQTAFLGTAALQAWHMALTAPVMVLSAMARSGTESVSRPEAETHSAEIVAMPVAPATKVAPNPLLLDAPRGGVGDDLTSLSGIGPKLASALNEFGIFHFDQIAGLNAEGIAWLNENQKGFAMMAERFDLVGQAKARIAE